MLKTLKFDAELGDKFSEIKILEISDWLRDFNKKNPEFFKKITCDEVISKVRDVGSYALESFFSDIVYWSKENEIDCFLSKFAKPIQMRKAHCLRDVLSVNESSSFFEKSIFIKDFDFNFMHRYIPSKITRQEANKLSSEIKFSYSFLIQQNNGEKITPAKRYSKRRSLFLNTLVVHCLFENTDFIEQFISDHKMFLNDDKTQEVFNMIKDEAMNGDKINKAYINIKTQVNSLKINLQEEQRHEKTFYIERDLVKEKAGLPENEVFKNIDEVLTLFCKKEDIELNRFGFVKGVGKSKESYHIATSQIEKIDVFKNFFHFLLDQSIVLTKKNLWNEDKRLIMFDWELKSNSNKKVKKVKI